MIDVLPPELLASIFVLATQSCHFHTHTDTYNRGSEKLTRIAIYGRSDLDYQPPWILGHVCSKWRAIAHSEPLLWRDLTLKTEVTGAMWAIYRVEETLPFGLRSIQLQQSIISGNVIDSLRPALPLKFANLRKLHLEMWLEPLVHTLEALAQSLPFLEDLRLVVKGPPEPAGGDLRDRLQRTQLSIIENVCRLTLGVIALRKSDSPYFGPTFDLLRSLSPCIQWHRLIYLDLSGMVIERKGHSDIDDFLVILNHCILLESLSCSLNISPGVPIQDHLSVVTFKPDFIPRLPNLISLNILLTWSLFPFLWEQLKELTLIMAQPSVFWILRQTPRLEFLTLEKCWRSHASGWIDTGSPPIILTYLYSLTLRDSHLQLLDSLIAPNLITLIIKKKRYRYYPTLERFDMKEILNFIRRSDPGLSLSLRVFHYDIRVKDLNTEEYRSLREVLTALSALRQLSVPRLLFTKNLLNSLKMGLLPNLQAVEFNVRSPAIFAQFVEERVNKGLEKDGFVRLKEGYGCYYPLSCPNGGVKGIENVMTRLRDLNGRYGTDFRFVQVARV